LLYSLTDFAFAFAELLPQLAMQPHMLHRHTPPSHMHPIAVPLPATRISQLHGNVANPLPVACAIWPCALQPYMPQHGPCHRPPCSHTHLITACLAAAQATSPPPYSCTGHIAAPIAAIHATSLHASQLHGPHHHPPFSCTGLTATQALSPPPLQPHGPYCCPPRSHMGLVAAPLAAT
jgi:hypothetical protein